MEKRSQWEDEDDWNRPRRTLRPDQIPPPNPGWTPGIVEWMYVVFGLLILVQILRFHLE